MNALENKENGKDYELKTRRLAAICMIIGSAAVILFRGLHGDLPAADAHASMQFIGAHFFYKGVHMGASIGVMFAVLGFVAFTQTLKNRYAATVSLLAVAIMLVGAALHIYEHTADGNAGQSLAVAWQNASPTEQANIEHAAFAVFTGLLGPSLVAISMLWGLSIILFSRAISHESYPSWLYWSGSIIGGLTFIGSIAQYLYMDIIPGFIIFGPLVFLVQLWTLALGIAILTRKVRNEQTKS